ncbi:HET-domain-containing protein [Staphylotrichum tortipilum]|uniref:HET-domain-containing protein n=1 Tax=Staphylotrichum tortipilum TaxID=2831512 RepID=A0AAN6MGT9_9PEZI|nr:HET-domain-containing protein [Staphylotrichum longicolle]
MDDDPSDFEFHHGLRRPLSCPTCRLASSLSLREEYVTGIRRKATIRWTGEFELFLPGSYATVEGSVEEGYAPPEYSGLRVLQFDLPARTDDARCFGLARGWMAACEGGRHGNCSRKAETTLPTRVLDVEGTGGVVLVETGGGMTGRYATLSHRWEAVLRCRTLRGNLEEHKRGEGLMRALPATFREAVVMCREVGIQYLWIDALCIVQDWDEDWDREAARMAEVYRNSVVTISALDSEGSSGGLFRDRAGMAEQAVTFASPLPGGGRMGMRVAAQTFEKEMKASPLTSRGWVFQERVLSTATLHYGAGQMTWECRSMIATERAGRIHDFMEALTYDFGRSLLVSRNDGWGTMKEWGDMLGFFTRKRFTFPTDRLPAVMGIAKLMETPLWGRSENVFIAGLWSGALAKQLLWTYDAADAHRTLGPPTLNLVWVPPGWKPRQPSWSWISVDYPVAFWGQDSEALVWHIRVVGWDRALLTDLAAYRTRSHEMELRLEGALLRIPIPAERLDLQKPVSRVMPLRFGRQVVEMEITIDPGCSIPRDLYALRVSSFSGHGGVPGRSATYFLLLERAHPTINQFKRIGVGSGDKDPVDEAFRGQPVDQVALV